jgi:hypothetical protein
LLALVAERPDRRRVESQEPASGSGQVNPPDSENAEHVSVAEEEDITGRL